jgi:peptide-methionine (S)-S-oxide reductase
MSAGLHPDRIFVRSMTYMMHRARLFALTLAAAVTLLAGGTLRPAAAAPTETAVFAGGCFWGMEAVFGALHGVKQAMPGYTGGGADTAHYDMVSTGTTGHAESVRVTYDPAVISYKQLLDVYFRIAHDPTELNRQGPDEGTQYRSAIFPLNNQQRLDAQAEIKTLTDEHVFGAPIVTKLEAYHGFFPAEDYHRNFVARNPDYPYVVINDLPKLAALKKSYPQLVAQK